MKKTLLLLFVITAIEAFSQKQSHKAAGSVSQDSVINKWTHAVVDVQALTTKLSVHKISNPTTPRRTFVIVN